MRTLWTPCRALPALALVIVAAAPPAPAQDSTHTVIPITWQQGVTSFSGSMYRPAGQGPFPTVLLIHASGNSTGDQWPYREHAIHFASNGIAAVVYDKRGTGRSGGTYLRLPDMDTLTADAAAGLATLATHPAVDPARLGAWGRSQGAWIVGRLSATSPHVRFAIPVVGGGATGLEQELFVQANWLRRRGLTAEQVAVADTVSRAVWHYYATGEGRATAQALLDRVRATPWFALGAADISGYPSSGVLEAPAEVAARRTTSFRWQAGLFRDPLADWRRTKVPVLALLAGSDAVTPTEATARAFQSLALNGSRVTVQIYPGTSHALCPTSEASPSVDGCTPVQEYFDAMVAWIRQI